MYTTLRHKYGNTSQHLATALALVNSSSTSKLMFFASPTGETSDYDANSDGPSTNFPLLCLLAQVELPGVHPVYVLCDGLFLTAARLPRYSEVQDLLDAACVSGKAHFSKVRAPFTSKLPADVATRELLENAQLAPLTSDSRKEYFKLLSSLSEAEYR